MQTNGTAHECNSNASLTRTADNQRIQQNHDNQKQSKPNPQRQEHVTNNEDKWKTNIPKHRRGAFLIQNKINYCYSGYLPLLASSSEKPVPAKILSWQRLWAMHFLPSRTDLGPRKFDVKQIFPDTANHNHKHISKNKLTSGYRKRSQDPEQSSNTWNFPRDFC